MAAVTTFQADQSPAFDSKSKAAAVQLISEAENAAHLVTQPEIAAALRTMAAAMQSIVDHALGNSATDLNTLKRATAQYLASVQRYQMLLAATCGTVPDGSSSK